MTEPVAKDKKRNAKDSTPVTFLPSHRGHIAGTAVRAVP